MKNYPNSPDEFLKHVDGKIYDVCETYYLQYLKPSTTSEQAAHNLRLFYENCGYVDTDKALVVETQTAPEIFQKLIESNEDIVKRIIENLIALNLSEEDFYKQLWEQMQNKVVFPTEESIVSVVIELLFYPKVPYFQLPEVPTMDDDVYMETVQNVRSAYQKAIFAINFGYAQKTQIAEQLLRIVGELDSAQAKAVLVANIYGYYDTKIKQFKEKIDELQKKLKKEEERPD